MHQQQYPPSALYKNRQQDSVRDDSSSREFNPQRHPIIIETQRRRKTKSTFCQRLRIIRVARKQRHEAMKAAKARARTPAPSPTTEDEQREEDRPQESQEPKMIVFTSFRHFVARQHFREIPREAVWEGLFCFLDIKKEWIFPQTAREKFIATQQIKQLTGKREQSVRSFLRCLQQTTYMTFFLPRAHKGKPSLSEQVIRILQVKQRQNKVFWNDGVRTWKNISNRLLQLGPFQPIEFGKPWWNSHVDFSRVMNASSFAFVFQNVFPLSFFSEL